MDFRPTYLAACLILSLYASNRNLKKTNNIHTQKKSQAELLIFLICFIHSPFISVNGSCIFLINWSHVELLSLSHIPYSIIKKIL